jgi:ubiquitin-protein ligase E3 B
MRRDAHQRFVPSSDWYVTNFKVSALVKGLEAGDKHANLLLSKLPHIIPHDKRIQLFRKYVANEKSELGLSNSSNVSTHPTLINGQ